MKRSCLVCHKRFNPAPHKVSGPSAQRYCSFLCQRQAYKERRKVQYEKVAWRACRNCGGGFKAHPTRVRGKLSQKYCSEPCAKAARNVSRRVYSAEQIKSGGLATAEALARRVPKTRAAYFAGLVDGEGTVTIYAGKSQNKGGQMRVTVANTHKGVLKEFQHTFGGSFYTQKPKGRKVMFYCHLSAWDAYACLRAIIPYMRIKRRHAQLCMEFQVERPELRGSRFEFHPEVAARRDRYLKAIRKLNS